MKITQYLLFSTMITILAFFLLNLRIVNAQEKKILTTKQTDSKSIKDDSTAFKNPLKPVVCEEALLYIEDAISKARKNPDGNLIFIHRLGSGESNKLADLRLKQVKAYASNFGIKTVFALGENVKGYGIWELYLEGKLLYSLPLLKNDNFNLVGGCIE